MKTLTTALILLLTALPAATQVQVLQAWWIDTGETNTTALGGDPTSIGDVNGDGLNDFAISAGGEELRAYLGTALPDTIPDIIIHKPNGHLDDFGNGLFGVGDINGDGYDDFVAGAQKQDISSSYRRFAFLYFGGPTLHTIPDWSLLGEPSPTSQYALWSCAGLGDMNGDGFNDLAITDPCYRVSYSPPIEGAIYIYYGGAALDSIPDVVIHANSVLNSLGTYVQTLGDVNQDGYCDFVMSDQNCQGPQGQLNSGVVAIYYGGNPPDTIPHLVIHGPAGSGLGRSLTILDWNDDGQRDIFAGNAILYQPNYQGSIWEFNVTSEMTGLQPDHVFLGQSGYGGGFGWYLFHVDLNGDGWQDLVDGEPQWNLCGKVYVILNGVGADTLFDATYYQGNFNAALGDDGGDVGDVNGDGIDDMAIREGYGGYGRVHLILGDDSLHQSVAEPIQHPSLPETAAEIQSYPNPFNPTTVASYELRIASQVSLQVYDVSGRLVSTLVNGLQAAGRHSVTFDGSKLASGLYFVRMQAGSYTAVQKLVLMK